MTVMGLRLASATATAVLPTPVGPTMTGVNGRTVGRSDGPSSRAAKTTFQFLFGQLHHTRPAVHVMCWERRAEQAHHQLAHLVGIERLTGLDRRATGVSRGEPLEPVLPSAEAPAGEIGDE